MTRNVLGAVLAIALLLPVICGGNGSAAELDRVSGVEIGNARFLPYRNEVSGFKARIPMDWAQFDLGVTVTFIEKIIGAGEFSAVNIGLVQLPEVFSEDDLMQYLRLAHPARIWKSLVIGDRPAFESVGDKDGLVYVLKRSGDVLAICFKLRAEEESKKDVEQIVKSLSFE